MALVVAMVRTSSWAAGGGVLVGVGSGVGVLVGTGIAVEQAVEITISSAKMNFAEWTAHLYLRLNWPFIASSPFLVTILIEIKTRLC